MPSRTDEDAQQTTEPTGRDTFPQSAGSASAPGQRRRPLFDLSLSQILGGSLAAATAAALGSKLGTAGTIGGAALASVVSAIAGSVYTVSVRRTGQGVQHVIARRGTGPARTTVVDSSDPSTSPSAAPASETAASALADHQSDATSAVAPGSGRITLSESDARVTGSGASFVPAAPSAATAYRPGTDPAAVDPAAADPAAVEPSAVDPAGSLPDGPDRRRKVLLRTVVLGSLAVFLIAALVVFGFEKVTGQALDGQRNSTTFGQVTDRSPEPKPKPTERSSPQPSASSSGQSSSSPTAQPSTSASTVPQPSASTSASEAPSASSGPSDPVGSSAPAGSGSTGSNPRSGSSTGTGSGGGSTGTGSGGGSTGTGSGG